MDGPYAEVPTHRDPKRAPDDFGALNKSMRACFICRLIKSEAQFREAGCDNCSFLHMDGDMDAVISYTTANFSGMLSVMNPKASWVSKWHHTAKYVPGCYSLAINDEIPVRIKDILESRGMHLPSSR